MNLLRISYRLLSGNSQHFANFMLNDISADGYGQKDKDLVSHDNLAHHVSKKMLHLSVEY
jgi:hypothetical protein